MYTRCLRSVSARAHRPVRRSLTTTLEQHGNSSSRPSPIMKDLSDLVAQPVTLDSGNTPPAHSEQDSNKAGQGATVRPSLRHTRAAMVKVEYGVKSLPMGLAIVQEIERRFGRIRDFRLLPDRDAPGDYLPYLFVEFENARALRHEQVLREKTIKFTIEPWDREQMVEGGPSLYDIQDYLRRPAQAEQENELENVIEVDASPEATGEPESSSLMEEAKIPAEAPESLEEDVEAEEGEKAEKNSRSRNEVNIQIVALGKNSAEHAFHSVQFPRHLITEARIVRNDLQTRFSQAFLQWSGFYPGYDFSDAGMEAASWRAHPYGRKPPPSITSSLSESQLQFAFLDKEVERAQRINKAQETMKATMFKRRMTLKELGATPEVHGLVFDEEKSQWVTVRTSKDESGALEELENTRLAKLKANREQLLQNLGSGKLWSEDKPAVKDAKKASSDKSKETELVKLVENIEVTVAEGQQTSKRAAKAGTNSKSTTEKQRSILLSTLSPKAHSSSKPPTAVPLSKKQASKKSKTSQKQKAASSSGSTRTSIPPRNMATKEQKRQPEPIKASSKGSNEQGGQDNLRSKILGWLRGGW